MSEVSEQVGRYMGTVLTATEMKVLRGFVDSDGRQLVSPVTCITVTSSMLDLAGTEVAFDVVGDEDCNERTDLNPSVVQRAFATTHPHSEWCWDTAMFKDIVEINPDAPEWAPNDAKFKIIRPVTGLTDEERATRMVDEFVYTWMRMRDQSCMRLPSLQHQKGGVRRIVERCIEMRKDATERYQLDDMLRCFIEVQLSPTEMMRSNENLRYLMDRFVNLWLIQSEYDLGTMNIAANTIHNKKGQEMRLTKAISRSVPEILPPDAAHLAAAIAFTNKLPNRDSFTALLATALSGVARIGLTANPIDFMTASWGGGFGSCHGPGGGHFSGNMGLALTPDVLMGFVGEPTAKKGRMWLYIDPSIPQLAQLKTYGIFPSHFRKPLREYIEHCLSPDARWVHKGNASIYINRLGGSTGAYFDSGYIDVGYLKASGFHENMSINSSPPICVLCGERQANSDYCSCRDCGGSDYMCCCCESDCNEDDDYCVDGDWYCNDCYWERYSRCEDCDEDVHNDDICTVYDRNGHERTVCESCRDHSYSYCDNCDQYHYSENVHEVRAPRSSDSTRYTTQYWCDSCREEAYYCETCDEYYTGDMYDSDLDCCFRCRADEYRECNECGAWKEKDEYDEALEMCHDCREDRYVKCQHCDEWTLKEVA